MPETIRDLKARHHMVTCRGPIPYDDVWHALVIDRRVVTAARSGATEDDAVRLLAQHLEGVALADRLGAVT